MKTTGEIKNITIDYKTGYANIELKLNTKEISQIEELQGLKLNVELNKWYPKRSLDANGYLWTLINQLEDRLSLPSKMIYRDAICSLGTYYVVPIKKEAVEAYKRIWEQNGIGWFCEEFESKLEGFVNLRTYYGSSAFNTKEMSKLIDLIVNECKEQGIETKSPEEIKSMGIK